ncbi:hypothetical protein FQA47_005534 [Oryzias melastigma]|uniref:Secreted protein n=1 Tax=Oryzias melastigma TaxID=30732 RepID=A0A834CDA4_ORYME|nr:hypothetical protein FQA47_005534 [Oryzias melastigma]
MRRSRMFHTFVTDLIWFLFSRGTFSLEEKSRKERCRTRTTSVHLTKNNPVCLFHAVILNPCEVQSSERINVNERQALMKVHGSHAVSFVGMSLIYNELRFSSFKT